MYGTDWKWADDQRSVDDRRLVIDRSVVDGLERWVVGRLVVGGQPFVCGRSYVEGESDGSSEVGGPRSGMAGRPVVAGRSDVNGRLIDGGWLAGLSQGLVASRLDVLCRLIGSAWPIRGGRPIKGRNGAGIQAKHSNVSLSGCSVMLGNATRGSGGGIYATGHSVVRMHSSYVQGNRAHAYGGGIWFGYYSSYPVEDSDIVSEPEAYLFIERTDVINNTASADGGGLYGRAVSLSIVDTRLWHNVAGRHCGGLCSHGSPTALCNLSAHMNLAGNSGGGVCAWGAEADAAKVQVEMSNSVVSSNTAVQEAGGLSVYYVGLTVCNSILQRNSATRGEGGGIVVIGSFLRIYTSDVLSNYAMSEGGGIFVASSDPQSPLLLAAVHVAHNLCDGYGGGISGGGLIEINGSEVSSNFASLNGGGIHLLTAGELWVHETNIALNYAGYEGGGIRSMERSQVRVTSRTNITENRSGKWGGGMSLAGGVNADLVMDGFSSVVRNTADRYSGGGISAYGLESAVLLDVSLVGNRAKANGGGISMDNSTLHLMGTLIFGNSAGTQGGAIFLERDSQVTATDSLFLSNTAQIAGAAISATNSTVQLGFNFSQEMLRIRQRRRRRALTQDLPHLRLEERGRHSSRALLTSPKDQQGEPEHIEGRSLSAASVCGSDVCIKDNEAPTGGALHLNGGHGALSGVHIEANRMLIEETCLEVVSQVTLVHGSTVHIEASTLVGNDGAGVEVGSECSATLAQVQVLGHLAESGAGVYVAERGAAALAQCTIALNRAGRTGGGIYSAGILAVASSHFLGNDATLDGGALHLSGNTNFILDGCNFTNNTAYNGAAIYCSLDGSLINSTAFNVAAGNITSTQMISLSFLERLYECDHSTPCIAEDDDPDTCDPGQNNRRQGAGIGGIVELRLCNLHVYTDSVMCGGTESVVCSEGYYQNMAFSKCLECPGLAVVWGQFIGATCIITTVTIAILTIFLKMHTTDHTAVKDTFSQKTAVELLKAKTAVSLIVGYFQVMGQLGSIYSTSLVSPIAQELLSPLKLLILDIGVSNAPDHPKAVPLLAKDTAHECNNLNWYISATVSVFTVIVFVLGFPVSLFLAMWRLRQFHAANSWVDMYIPRDAFLSGVGGEKAIEQQEKLLEVNWGACNTGRVCRARSRNSLARAETTRVGLRSWIILRDGSLIIDAEALTKEDTGDRGVIQMVPVTRLDAPNFSKILGHFHQPFEDCFYAWQCALAVVYVGLALWDVCSYTMRTSLSHAVHQSDVARFD
eukprot:gene2232-2946_t